jgi:hypothetical protein
MKLCCRLLCGVLLLLGLRSISAAAAQAAVRPLVVIALSNPRGLAVDRPGNLYFGDVDSGAGQKITPAGIVTALGGLGAAAK